MAVLESFVCCEPAIMDEELSKIRFTGQLCDEFYNTGENFGKRREVGHGFSACKQVHVSCCSVKMAIKERRGSFCVIYSTF